MGFALGLAGAWALALPSLRKPLLEFLRAHWLVGGVGLALTGLALIPLALPYLAAGKAVGYRTFEDAQGMLPRFQSWFNLGWQSWLYGWAGQLPTFARLPMEWEHRLGLGFVTTLVVLYALWRERARPLVRVCAAVAITIILLTSYYRFGFMPWRYVFAVVPGADAIRAVSRIGMLLLIPASLGLAYFLERARGGKRGWLAVLLAIFCLAEQAQKPPSYDKAQARAPVDSLKAAIPPGCAVFFYAPARAERPWEWTQLDATWASLESGVPTVNGYSGNWPRGWQLHQHAIADEAKREELREELKRWLSSRKVSEGEVCWVEL